MGQKLDRISRKFVGKAVEVVEGLRDGEGHNVVMPLPQDPVIRDLRESALSNHFSGICVAAPGLEAHHAHKDVLTAHLKEDKRHVWRIDSITNG